MDKKLIYLIGGVVFLIILAIVVAVSSGSKHSTNNLPTGPVVLTFWKTFEDSQNMQALFEAYRQKHPNVEIVYTKKNIENYEKDLLNALASGTGPDIFSINNAWLPGYLDKIAPVDEKAFSIKEYKDAFVDTAVEDFTEGGKIYGVPLSVDSLALYYNKDLLGTAGIAVPAKTWQELSDQVKQVTLKDSKGYFTRSAVPLGLSQNINRGVDIYYLFMLQLGFKPDGLKSNFGSLSQTIQKGEQTFAPARDALDFYTSFANPKSTNYNWNSRSDYSIDAFVNGRSAYLYSYAYTQGTILQKAPNMRFDVAPAPQFSLDDPAVNFSNYWGEVVSKQSKNQAVAWDFLKFITSKEALDKYYAVHKQPASRKDLIELQIQDPDIGVFAAANLTAHSFDRPEQNKFDSIIGQVIDSVVLKGVSLDEAVSRAEQQVSTLFRE
ncbi:MAG: sugar ABC transporter substrate-binding protein [Candidatus Doudnabacteria bacterium]|nr:sugar ABC transporter substrate-binding protein [Candidatus Doudnabacteria bacterium]